MRGKRAHRAHQISLRMTEEEKKRASGVAKHYAITIADAIRMLLKREHDEIEARKGSTKESAELNQMLLAGWPGK